MADSLTSNDRATNQKPLVCAFKRGDMVRWNAIAFNEQEAKGWRVTGLAVANGLLPIYSVRKGRLTGEAVQDELEAE